MIIDPMSLLEKSVRQSNEAISHPLPPLLMWGGFIFQLSTLAFNRLTLTDSWNWATQSRIGRRDSLQYTGKKTATLRFSCELYDDFVDTSGLSELIPEVGTWQDANNDPVEWLRHQADTRTPLMLVTGYGRVLGLWVLTQLDQSVDEFRGAGEFQHQMVALALQYYGSSLDGGSDVPAEVETANPTTTDQAVSDMNTFLTEHARV